ncbi:hypothetical protein JW935_04625 [candidate division KSB1 bacterium]|nr:hypothetical protein [candidate division KSB1 bacterium]
MLREHFYIKTLHAFLAIIVVSLIDTFIMQHYVMTRETYFTLFSEQLDAYRVEELITVIKNMSLWSYFLGPLFIFFHLIITSLFIQLPLVFRFIDIPFAKIFRAVTFAYFAVLAIGISKLIYLLQIPAHQMSENKLAFMPLSITTFINPESYPRYIVSFLGNFNIFCLCWIVVLTFLLSATTKIKRSTSALVVLSVWTFGLVFQFVVFNYINRVYS